MHHDSKELGAPEITDKPWSSIQFVIYGKREALGLTSKTLSKEGPNPPTPFCSAEEVNAQLRCPWQQQQQQQNLQITNYEPFLIDNMAFFCLEIDRITDQIRFSLVLLFRIFLLKGDH